MTGHVILCTKVPYWRYCAGGPDESHMGGPVLESRHGRSY